MKVWQDEAGDWYFHGPDDENHAGPFATEAEAEDYANENKWEGSS